MHGIWDRTLCYGQEHKLKKEYRLLQVADNLKVAIQPNKALPYFTWGKWGGQYDPRPTSVWKICCVYYFFIKMWNLVQIGCSSVELPGVTSIFDNVFFIFGKFEVPKSQKILSGKNKMKIAFSIQNLLTFLKDNNFSEISMAYWKKNADISEDMSLVFLSYVVLLACQVS